MIFIFGTAIFLSAVLLFLIQPMAAKLVLPILGGTPNVWNTAMVFFQTMLLLGYFYSHILTRKLRLPAQFIVHAVLMGLVLLALPIALPGEKWMPGSGFSPSTWLLVVLALIAGLPYFAVATTGPLLQAWFGATDDRRAKDPYFLYAASNAGSLLGLLSFPFLVEPNFILSGQSEVWTVGYALLAVLVLGAGARALRRRRPEAEVAVSDLARESLSWRRRFLWVALAAAPSSLSLSATTTITMDVAAVPLLWIMPLSVYLLSYILAFSNVFGLSAVAAGRIAVAAVLLVIFNHLYDIHYPLPLVIGAHLLAMGACAFACHRRLFELRPPTSRLTEFYLLAALGGALGGALVALLAPKVFSSLLEYPLALAACLVLVAPSAASQRTRWWKHLLFSALSALAVFGIGMALPKVVSAQDFFVVSTVCLGAFFLLLLVYFPGGNYRFAAATFALFMLSIYQYRAAHGLLFAGRSFFGTYSIFRNQDRTRLMHGTTLHGEQLRDPNLSRIPVTYYHPAGPLGDVFAELREGSKPLRVAIVGLGAGSVAAYAREGDHFTFFEIDPLVRAIATDPHLFTYVSDAQSRGAAIDFILGDGRLGIASSKDSYDLVILDAFSSDSIPVHLFTREALQIYAGHLRPGGMVAFHTSNRYFNLALMGAQLAASDDLYSVTRSDRMREPDAERARIASEWVAVAPTTEPLIRLLKRPEWYRADINPGDRVWTDSYSSLFDVHWR